MKTRIQINSKNFLKILTGLILLGVSAAYWLVPAGIRDESGEAYIVIACLLAIGCGFLYYGLADRS